MRKGEDNMKKRILIYIIVAIIFAILFIPIPKTLDDGGTKVYTALTYKYIKWNRYVDESKTRIFKHSRIYVFGSLKKSIDELYEDEIELYNSQFICG